LNPLSAETEPVMNVSFRRISSEKDQSGFLEIRPGSRQGYEQILVALGDGPATLEEIEERLGWSGPDASAHFQRRDLIGFLTEMADRGLVEIRFPGSPHVLEGFRKGLLHAQSACSLDPGLWNVLSYEIEWFRYRDYFEFLDPSAPNHRLKRLEHRLYLRQFEACLKRELRPGSRVLDAGGGVGRFSSELLRKGYEVVLVDASERALRIALRHFVERGFRNYSLVLGDVRNLAAFPDDSFDAVIAMELLCYCTRPEDALREIMRVVVPGGYMIFSVEGKYGSLLTDSKIGLGQFEAVWRNNVLHREHDVFVRYHTEDEFRTFLESNGVSVLETRGSHYVPDGIFHRFLGEAGDWTDDVEARVFEIEDCCSRDPVLKPLARAWTAVCRNAAS